MPSNAFSLSAPALEKQYSVTPAHATSTHSTVNQTSGPTR